MNLPYLTIMSEIIDRLLSIDTAEALSTSIMKSMPDLYELYNSGWDTHMCRPRRDK